MPPAQSQANDMFDALWKTFKEGNKKMTSEGSAQSKQKRPSKSIAIKTSEASAVPIITAPAVHTIKVPKVKEFIAEPDNVTLAKVSFEDRLQKLNLALFLLNLGSDVSAKSGKSIKSPTGEEGKKSFLTVNVS